MIHTNLTEKLNEFSKKCMFFSVTYKTYSPASNGNDYNDRDQIYSMK